MGIKGFFNHIVDKFNKEDQVNSDADKLINLKNNIDGHCLFKRRTYNKICLKYGCFVPLSCKIGGGITFPHGLYGIFISQKAVVGDNCVIFQQVTIGSNNLKDSKGIGAPVIGNNVYLGAGSKIIGNCHIGNNVRVGANVVVTEDVPDNCTVVCGRQKVIVHDKVRDNRFVPI